MNNYCCITMKENLEDQRVPILYDPIKRKYYVQLKFQGKTVAHQCFIFCPFCGVHLPKDLCEEYYDFLEKEYGLEVRDIVDGKAILPEEFKSDKWWKMRGL